MPTDQTMDDLACVKGRRTIAIRLDFATGECSIRQLNGQQEIDRSLCAFLELFFVEGFIERDECWDDVAGGFWIG